MIELAKRAVACKNWKWMRGMRTIDQLTIVNINDDTSLRFTDYYPDLSDPATVGCLLDLVRKAWHTAPANVNCHMSYSPNKGHYRNWTCSYCTGESWNQTIGETEVEALVLALEASNG